MATELNYISTAEGNQTSRIYDISREVRLLTTFSPIIYQLASANQMPTADVRFQWDEADMLTDSTTANGAFLFNDATIVVTDSSIFNVGDLIRDMLTDEVMQITANDTTTNTITVVRGVGNAGVGLASSGAADPLLNIGPAYEEGSVDPETTIGDTTTVYNYAQIFRMGVQLTGSKMRTLSTPGTDLNSLRQRRLEEILRAIEFSFIFGKRDENTTDFNEVRHTTGGALSMIATNVDSGVGAMTEDDWNTFLAEMAFWKGSNRKLMICGYKIMEALSKYGRSYIQTQIGINGLGYSVSTYVSPTGKTLDIFSHELFQANDARSGLGIVIDPTDIMLRYTQDPANPSMNGQLVYRENLQSNSRDGVHGEYFAEVGLHLANELKHAVISGVTGGA